MWWLVQRSPISAMEWGLIIPWSLVRIQPGPPIRESFTYTVGRLTVAVSSFVPLVATYVGVCNGICPTINAPALRYHPTMLNRGSGDGQVLD